MTNSPTRSVHWVSALDERNIEKLDQLDRRLQTYYRTSETYYNDIDFTADSWKDDPVYRHIAKAASGANKILEVGCGKANFLLHYPNLAKHYTGVDISSLLIDRNREVYSEASFSVMPNSGRLPFLDAEFDFVFSIFVIEHCVFPHRALQEWTRVIKPGGHFLLFCPDFLSCGRMSSQRAGFSPGTGREKLKQGKFLDALVSGFDSRLRLPFYCLLYRALVLLRPRFWINLNPTCFSDPFQIDLDAVYVTCAPEIRRFLSGTMKFLPLPKNLAKNVRTRSVILLEAVRNNA